MLSQWIILPIYYGSRHVALLVGRSHIRVPRFFVPYVHPGNIPCLVCVQCAWMISKLPVFPDLSSFFSKLPLFFLCSERPLHWLPNPQEDHTIAFDVDRQLLVFWQNRYSLSSLPVARPQRNCMSDTRSQRRRDSRDFVSLPLSLP